MPTKQGGATASEEREILRAVDTAWMRLMSEQGFLCRALPEKSQRMAVRALTRQIALEYLRPEGVVYYSREDVQGLHKAGELSLSCGALRREWDEAVAEKVTEAMHSAGLSVSRFGRSNTLTVRLLPATPAGGSA